MYCTNVLYGNMITYDPVPKIMQIVTYKIQYQNTVYCNASNQHLFLFCYISRIFLVYFHNIQRLFFYFYIKYSINQCFTHILSDYCVCYQSDRIWTSCSLSCQLISLRQIIVFSLLVSACLYKAVVTKNVSTELVKEIITLHSATFKMHQYPTLSAPGSARPNLPESHPDARA